MTIKLVLDSIDDIAREINTNITNFNNFNNELGTKIHNFSEEFMINLKKIDEDIKQKLKINKT
jgi:hypothetical protein